MSNYFDTFVKETTVSRLESSPEFTPEQLARRETAEKVREENRRFIPGRGGPRPLVVMSEIRAAHEAREGTPPEEVFSPEDAQLCRQFLEYAEGIAVTPDRLPGSETYVDPARSLPSVCGYTIGYTETPKERGAWPDVLLCQDGLLKRGGTRNIKMNTAGIILRPVIGRWEQAPFNPDRVGKKPKEYVFNTFELAEVLKAHAVRAAQEVGIGAQPPA